LIYGALQSVTVRYQQSYPQKLGMDDKTMTNQALTQQTAGVFTRKWAKKWNFG
jgi:hypothetical protein